MDWIGVPDAAARLGLSAQRVRQLINDGDLDARKLAGRWLIDPRSVERLANCERPPGRPWAPPRAWALLALAAGRHATWLSASDSRRVQEILASRRVRNIVAHVHQRAHRREWYIHPGLLDRFLAEEAVVISGARASGKLRDSGPVDVYVHPDVVDDLVDRYVPDQNADEPNLVVRAVRGPWPFAPGEREVWPLVAAVDLLERGDDARAREVAEELLADA